MLEALEEVKNGESKAVVRRDIGVPESTLGHWNISVEKINNRIRERRCYGSSIKENDAPMT
ncbi:hypothetical protein HN011_005933 [Eciton burchellii]|nr:hypothetical protein HN011_005933 [Eciton burchellii]